MARNTTQGRPKRTPINGRNVLTVTGKDPNYVYRIVNDVGGRVDMFKEAVHELEQTIKKEALAKNDLPSGKLEITRD